MEKKAVRFGVVSLLVEGFALTAIRQIPLEKKRGMNMNVREGVEQMVCAVGAFTEFALRDEVLLTMVEAGGGALFRRYFHLQEMRR